MSLTLQELTSGRIPRASTGGRIIDDANSPTCDASGNVVITGTSTLTGEVQVGGGYGSTGVTITAAGALSMDGALIINTALGTYQMELGDTSTDLRARMTGNTNNRLAFQKGSSSVVWLGSSGPDQLQISRGDDTQIASFTTPITGGATTLSVDANGFVIRTPSDERYKANQKEITEGIDYVRAIPAISFEFSGKMAKQMGPGRHIGWGAQTVRDKVPYELVSGNDDLSLNDPKMGALLWSASRHLDAEITAIKAALAANNIRV